MSSTAPAPSEICDEVPAVWTPSGRLVRRPARLSSDVARRPSSFVIVVSVSSGLRSSSSSGAWIGVIWVLKRSSAQPWKDGCSHVYRWRTPVLQQRRSLAPGPGRHLCQPRLVERQSRRAAIDPPADTAGAAA